MLEVKDSRCALIISDGSPYILTKSLLKQIFPALTDSDIIAEDDITVSGHVGYIVRFGDEFAISNDASIDRYTVRVVRTANWSDGDYVVLTHGVTYPRSAIVFGLLIIGDSQA